MYTAKNEELVELWTSQRIPVCDILLREGVCRVKRDYVAEKYRGAGPSFREAYGFFAEEAAKRLAPAPGEASPYWLYGTPELAGNYAGSFLLRLSIPRSQCVFFDSRKWNRVLNLDFLGDEAACAAFSRKLEEQGLSCGAEAFLKPYYPQLRQEIRQSWKALFSDESIPLAYLQAASWRLEREWWTNRKEYERQAGIWDGQS